MCKGYKRWYLGKLLNFNLKRGNTKAKGEKIKWLKACITIMFHHQHQSELKTVKGTHMEQEAADKWEIIFHVIKGVNNVKMNTMFQKQSWC